MQVLVAVSIAALLSETSSQVLDVPPCETPNVRTVLFRQIDLVKECWSDEELALLYARRLIQELIPKRVTCNIPILLDYIIMILDTAKSIASSAKAHRLLLMAISDAFGGYLQAYGLPQTNAKYYEGALSYCTAHQMNELQSEFRKVLGTDGGGWTRPIFVKRPASCAQPFKLRMVDRCVCNNLVTSLQTPEGTRNTEPAVPLPFLDDTKQPRAIAVPFKDRSLYSLFAKNASDVLIKYYSVVLTCIGPPNPGACSDPTYNQKIEYFIVSYHAWLSRAILPHLHDEAWYPAFGGVYTIIQEMETRGLVTQDVQYSDNVDDEFALKPIEVNECAPSNIWFYMWIVFCLFLLFWIIVCNICCLLKYCGRNNECEYAISPTTSSSGVVINSLVATYYEHEEMKGLSLSDTR